jgi:uncharacterized protein
MNADLTQKLKGIAIERMAQNDASHGSDHAIRVTLLAEHIAREEQTGDLDVIVPAALFHDLIVYPKNDPRSPFEAQESAEAAEEILKSLPDFPQEKIADVMTCITQCSYNKGIIPDLIESKILQDADRMEATGAIAIMRTFASTQHMGSKFFHSEDPFCEHREPDPFNYGVDLFYARLLKVEGGMHTQTARNMARRRTKLLEDFLDELRLELQGE